MEKDTAYTIPIDLRLEAAKAMDTVKPEIIKYEDLKASLSEFKSEPTDNIPHDNAKY
jgi:hypothetical protein